MKRLLLTLCLSMIIFDNEEAVGMSKFAVLNSGYRIPMLGLGTWTLDNEKAEECVYQAIKIGYRLIDTARYYGNEIGVGKAIRRAINEGIVSREDLFVTSKILPSTAPDQAIDEALRDLGVEYIDLMLIHQPGNEDEKTYKVLERAVKSGKVRSIGISNYYDQTAFRRITKNAEIMPAIVQNENHLYYQNTKLKKYLKNFGILIESWYPLGGRGNTKENLTNPIVQKIAEKHKRTAAQIILRWQIQTGYIVIPGSGNPKHMDENFKIFDFELSNDEIEQISELNRNQRYENW